MKSRKPQAGEVSRKFDKLAVIQRQIARERQRHGNAVASIAAQRDALHGVADPALRAAKLADLRHREVEEHQRHKSKIDELQRRLREVWR